MDKAQVAFTKRFFLLWIPLILVTAGVAGLLYRDETDARLGLLMAGEVHELLLAEEIISHEFRILSGDIRILSSGTPLNHWLERPDDRLRAQVEYDFTSFSRERGVYDQIRLLDEHGRERIRVNWNNGAPAAVPESELQDKLARYYVTETMKLPEGAIYASPLDLNIEHKQIELPIKPMLRIGMPLFDHTHRLCGAIILNYLGQPLLDRLRSMRDEMGDHHWLLNSEGYWMAGPSADLEWGFMYPDRHNARIQLHYPNAWEEIHRRGGSGQFTNPNGLFTFKIIHTMVPGTHPASEHWILLSHIPADKLPNALSDNQSLFILAGIALLLMLTAMSGMFAYYGLLRERSDNEIRDTAKRYQSLLNSAPDAIIITDREGRIRLINEQAVAWFGYERRELIGQPIEVLVPPRFRDRHVLVRQAYMDQARLREMGKGLELFGTKKDGTEFPVEISLSPLHTQGEMLVTSIIRDISQRREMEKSKLQTENRYRNLLNNLPVGVYRSTPGENGRFLEVNQAMVKMFEAESAQDLMSRPLSSFHPNPEDRDAFSDILLDTGELHIVELPLISCKGREFFAAVTAVMRKNEQGGIYFDGLVENISERKQHEQRIHKLNEVLRSRTASLESTNQELAAFSYSVSHDLRTPLRAIDGFSHALLNQYAGQLDDKGKDRLQRIRNAAQRMSCLIDDLLKLSRITRTEVNRQTFNLAELARQSFEILQQGSPERIIRLSTPSELSADGDPKLMRVVLDNLIGNAWKFTSKRADAVIEVGMQAEQQDPPVYYARDNGAGFDMNYADKLFGAFQRLHDQNEFPGTGIGLATVQRIIHKHGGRIWAEGRVGEGATFYFTLNGKVHE